MLRKRQLEESAAAEPTYQAGLAALGWYQGGGYVITDGLGVRSPGVVLRRVRPPAPPRSPGFTRSLSAATRQTLVSAARKTPADSW